MSEQKRGRKRWGHNFIVSIVLLLAGILILFVFSTAMIYHNERESAKEKSDMLTWRVADEFDSALTRINTISMSLFLTQTFQEQALQLREGTSETISGIVDYFEMVAIADEALVKNAVYVPYGEDGAANKNLIVNYGSNYDYVGNNIDRIVALAKETEFSDGRLFYTNVYFWTGELTSYLAFARVIRGITPATYFSNIGVGVVFVQGEQLREIVHYARTLDGFEIAVWDDAARNVKERSSSVLFASHDSFDPSVRTQESYYSKTYTTSYFSWKITGYYDVWYAFKSGYSTFVTYAVILVLACGLLSFFSIFIYSKSANAYDYLYRQFSDRQKISDGSFGHISYTKNEQVNQVIESFNSLSDSVNALNGVVREQEKKALSLQLENVQFRLESLYSQINKHFLINVLAVVRSLVNLGEKEQANYCLENLSVFLRTILTIEDTASVKQEIRTLESYLNLQRVRYPKVECDILCDESLLECSIPKMLLQPIVENVFIHGLKNKKGRIRVVFRKRKGGMLLFVLDNGVGMEKEREREVNESLRTLKNPAGSSAEETHGVALLNIQKRLQLIAGEKSSVRVKSLASGGVVTLVRIYFKGEKEDLS